MSAAASSSRCSCCRRSPRWRRTRCAADARAPGPAGAALAPLCFAAGIALVVVALVSPVAHIGEELILAHMAQHVLMADLAALLHGAGPDRAAAAADARHAARAQPARARAPGRGVRAVGDRPLRLAPAGPLPGGARLGARARAAARQLRLLRLHDVAGAARPAAPAGVVRQRRPAALHRRRAAHRRAARQRLPVVGERASIPTTGPGRRAGTSRRSRTRAWRARS